MTCFVVSHSVATSQAPQAANLARLRAPAATDRARSNCESNHARFAGESLSSLSGRTTTPSAAVGASNRMLASFSALLYHRPVAGSVPVHLQNCAVVFDPLVSNNALRKQLSSRILSGTKCRLHCCGVGGGASGDTPAAGRHSNTLASPDIFVLRDHAQPATTRGYRGARAAPARAHVPAHRSRARSNF